MASEVERETNIMVKEYSTGCGCGFTYDMNGVLDHRSVFKVPASGWTLTELEADIFPLPMPFLTRIASICGPMR